MKKALAAVSLVALMSCAAFAEVGHVTASILPGASIPVGSGWANTFGVDPIGGNYNYGYDTSFALAVSADYQFSESLAAGLEIGDSFNYTSKQMPTNDSGMNVRILQFTPYIKVIGKTMDKLTPYGILGMGVYSTKMSDEVFNNETLTYSAVNYFGFNIGGGVMYDLAKNIQLGVDVRWHRIFAKDIYGNNVPLNNIVPSLKLSYLF